MYGRNAVASFNPYNPILYRVYIMKRFDAETIQSLLKQSGFTIVQTESRPTVSKIKATHKYGELDIEYTDSELGLSLRSSSELEILVNKRVVVLAFDNNVFTERCVEQKPHSFNTKTLFLEASKSLNNFIKKMEYVFNHK